MSDGRQMPLDYPSRPAYGMADFVVARCNEGAVAWLDRWPRWPGPLLVIHGPPGCGKTHLAHAFQARTGAAFITPEDLGRAEPPELLGRARAFVLDDARMEGGEEEVTLLHLHNMVAEIGGHALLTARRPPSRWRVGLPDLASRLLAAPAVAMEEPDDELIRAVIAKMFSDRQLRVGREVLDYLVRRIERSFSAARRAVERIDEAALEERRNITVHFVRDVLDGWTASE